MKTNPRLYALALRLYPANFRHRYAEEMFETARIEYAKSSHPLRFTAVLAADTLRSVLREHLRAATPGSLDYIAAFALFFSFLLLTVSVVHQQILRRAADRTPSFLVRLVSIPLPAAQSEAIRAHIVADILSPERTVEISSPAFLDSNLTFTVLYDTSGRALGGNATLHGFLPQPPHGIFDIVQQRGEDKVTWQPQPGVRVALTVRPMPNGGFVLSGHSLIPSEARTARFDHLTLWVWAFAMLTCAILFILKQRRAAHPTT